MTILNSDKKLKGGGLVWCSFIILLVVAAFRDGKYFYDYTNYANYVDNFYYTSGEFVSKELFFVLIAAFSQLFSNPAGVFFFIFAFISLIVKFHALKRGASHFYFSLFIFICLFYIPHELTQIRVSVAAAFFMLAYICILEDKKVSFYFYCLLAMCFHYSAIILIPMYYLLRRRLHFNFAFMLLPFLGYFFHLISFLEYIIEYIVYLTPQGMSNKVVLYDEFVNNGDMEKIKLFNLNFVLFLSLYLLSSIPIFLTKITYSIDRELVIIWRLMSICIFVYFSFSYIAVLSFRMYELLSVPLVISAPCIIYYYRQKILLIFICICIFILFLVLNIVNLVNF